MEENSKIEKLSGRSNYYGWRKLIKLELMSRGYMNEDNEIEEEHELKSAVLIMKSIKLDIVALCPKQLASEILNWLNEEYGVTDVWAAKRKLKNIKMLGIDLLAYWKDFNAAYVAFKAADGNMDYFDLCELVLESIHSDFYLDVIRSTRIKLEEKADVTESDFLKLKKDLTTHFNATPAEVKSKFSIKSANKSEKRKARQCQLCSNNGRQAIMATHDTDFCKYKNFKGTGWPLKQLSSANNCSSNDDANKGESNHYSKLAFHDSGSTPKSFFKDKPDNYEPYNGTVLTAGNQSVPIVGKGTIRFGDLTLEEVYHVPSFDKNLVSGIDIMNKNKDLKQVIENNKLTVYEKDQIIATGTFNPKYGLIQMDPEIKTNLNCNLSYQQVHDRLGHVSMQTLKRTIPAVNGLPVSTIPQMQPLCEDCIQGKTKRLKTPKASLTDRDLLEVIESDLTGPFRYPGLDGTRLNVKFIDRKSGYIKMATIANKEPSTILEKFKPFKSRLERRTGKLIKNVATDDGNEYRGAFITYLEQEGIVKMTSTPYQHTNPGKAERSHQTILYMARTMLSASKLPIKFYSEAQLTAAYLYNRFVHKGRDITPYEYIYGRKPDLSHLQPFGCVCYAHVPVETNIHGKLGNTAVKCRMIGYADEDDTEINKGYKLYRVANDETNDPESMIFYSKDVVFPESPLFEPLRNHDYTDDDYDYDNVFVDPNYVDEGRESQSSETSDESESEMPSESTEGSTPSESISNESYPEESTPSESPSNESYPEESTQSDPEVESEASYAPSPSPISSNASALANESIDPKLVHECLVAVGSLPSTYDEAINSKESDQWLLAMQREMESIKQHQTWQTARLPRNRKPIKCRWVFTKKYDKHGNVKKFKARLVAKGFSQKHGLDFNETFSPVVKFKSIRVLTALAAHHKMMMYQDDVPTAFLKGTLKEEIYMHQVPGFKEGAPDEVLRLNKTLYGLKQSPREWFFVINSFLKSHGFHQTISDPCIYSRKTEKGITFIGVYVDDVVTCGTCQDEVDSFRQELRQHFQITEGGPLEWYLGISFDQSKGYITIDQVQFLTSKLQEFHNFIGKGGASTPLPNNYLELLNEAELDTNTITNFPYRQMVGSLMYAMIATRPDLATAVGIVSRFLDKPKRIHCELVKHIYRYIRSNLSFKLRYDSHDSSVQLTGYVDASYGNNENYKSTSGFAFMLGNGLISWYSGRQSVVAQSTAEAEYYAAVKGANECIWLKQLLNELGYPQGTVRIYEDNEACIALSKNPQDHKRTKHVQIKYHVLRSYVEQEELKLVYIPTKSQLADIFTKGVPGPMLRSNLMKLGLTNQGES